MGIKLAFGRISKAALLAVIIATAAIVHPGSASAGTCSTPGCGGKVINQVNANIWIANCWHDTSGGYAGSQPPCVTIWSQSKYNAGWYLAPGGYSTDLGKYYYDVDAWQAPAGCITAGYVSGSSSFSIDRRGKSAYWTRVYGTQTAYITGIQC
jgi:hypothetical protein